MFGVGSQYVQVDKICQLKFDEQKTASRVV
jgi:hypothetical protein